MANGKNTSSGVGLFVWILISPRNHNLFSSSKINVNCQSRDSLPSHLHNIGRPILDNRETKTLVQSMPLFKEPKFMPFCDTKCDGDMCKTSRL